MYGIPGLKEMSRRRQAQDDFVKARSGKVESGFRSIPRPAKESRAGSRLTAQDPIRERRARPCAAMKDYDVSSSFGSYAIVKSLDNLEFTGPGGQRADNVGR
jgi:hypothetical protein